MFMGVMRRGTIHCRLLMRYTLFYSPSMQPQAVTRPGYMVVNQYNLFGVVSLRRRFLSAITAPINAFFF